MLLRATKFENFRLHVVASAHCYCSCKCPDLSWTCMMYVCVLRLRFHSRKRTRTRSLVSIGFIHFPEYFQALIFTKVFVFGVCREEAAIRSYLYRGGWEQTWMVWAFPLTNYSSSESPLCPRLCDPSENCEVVGIVGACDQSGKHWGVI